MDLGMPTLIETADIAQCAALCHALGLQFIELNMNLPQYQPQQMDVDHFAKLAEDYGIYYTIHLDENLNVCDFNAAVAQAYVQTVQRTIGIAKQLGIPVLNMHMSTGVYFTLPHRKVHLFEAYLDQYLQTLRIFRDQCAQWIGGANIKICIENSGALEPFQQAGIDTLLENHCFALTFDTGHNHMRGNIHEEFMLPRHPRLHHMHIHDASALSDHLALGTGDIDLPKCFKLAHQSGCRVVLETKTISGLKQSALWAKNHIGEL